MEIILRFDKYCFEKMYCLPVVRAFGDGHFEWSPTLFDYVQITNGMHNKSTGPTVQRPRNAVLLEQGKCQFIQ